MLAAYSTADEIEGGPCPKCRAPMMLGRVMPEPPDFDLYTFMCPQCEFVKCLAVEASATQASLVSSPQERAPGAGRAKSRFPKQQISRVRVQRCPSICAAGTGSLSRSSVWTVRLRNHWVASPLAH